MGHGEVADLATQHVWPALQRSGLWAALTECDDQGLVKPVTLHRTVGGRVLGRSGR